MADVRCISGGDEADGAAGFSGDEDNYSYKNHVDDNDNSEQEPDFTNRSALGPKDLYFSVPHRFRPESGNSAGFRRNGTGIRRNGTGICRNDRTPAEWHRNGSIPEE